MTTDSMEYLYRLRDECLLLKQCDNMLVFFKDIEDEEKTARISLLKLEHIYYKKDSLYEKSKALLKK